MMEYIQKRKIFGKSMVFLFLFLTWVVNAVLRIFFGYLTASGVQLLDTPVTSSVLNALVAVFLFLGLSGLFVSIGLWQKKRWGYAGTMLVILATIVFDIWGMTLQYTAAMGFVVPALVLIYLTVNKSVFFKTNGPLLVVSNHGVD